MNGAGRAICERGKPAFADKIVRMEPAGANLCQFSLAEPVVPDKTTKSYYDERKIRYCKLLDALHGWE